MVYWPQMGERLTGQHHEDTQAIQQLDSAIVGFCDQFTSTNTKAAYKRDLRDFSRFAREAGVDQRDKLTPELIDGYFQDCERSGLSTATIRRRIASLSGLLAHEGMEQLARETKSMGYNRAGSTEEREPFHPLSDEEVKRLKEVSKHHFRNAAIIAIALGTGATTGEIRALNMNDILEKESGQVAVLFRGNESEREITLGSDPSAIVGRYKGSREGEEPLFVQNWSIKRGKKRLSRQGIWKSIKEYGDRIGRPDLNPTVLRQTFIANVPTNDSKELADLLGVREHTSVRLLRQRRLTQQLPQNEVLFETTTK